MIKRLIMLMFISTSLMFSCNDNVEIKKDSQIKVNEAAIATVINFVDFNVKAFQKNPDIAGSDRDMLILNNISGFEKAYNVNLNYSSKSISTNAKTGSALDTEVGIELQRRIVNLSSTTNDENEFLSKLSSLKSEVINYELDSESKSDLLTHIVLIERLVEYMDKKADTETVILNKSGNTSAKQEACDGWWSCWGKCVAGTLGGAGTGSLTFGLGGAAVGTAVLPIVGTVSLGAVGAIGGAIAGGLTGAAASCD